MPEDIRISGRPQVARQRSPQQVPVLARIESHGGAMPAHDANAIGLLQGLAKLNPVMEDYFKVQTLEQVNEADQQAAVDVQRMADPRTALSAPIEGPADAPPAYALTYRRELQKGLANRAASEIRTETIAAYSQDSMKPDFDAQSWLADKRQKAMAGVSDPTSQAIIGAHFGTLEEQIRGEDIRRNTQRLQEVNASTAAAYAADSFTGNMKPEELGAAYPLFLEKSKGLGYSAKEANQIMFQQLEHESNKLGGAPELFDVFDQKGPDGQTIRFHHPELMQHIDQAKARASQARQKAINDAAEHGNAAILMGYESALEKDPFSITPEMIFNHQTPNGPFPRAEAAASMWAKTLDAQHKKRELMQNDHLFDTGELWRVDNGVQDKVLTARLAPAIEALSQATKTGDPAAAAQVGAQIMQAQSRSGSTVPSDQVARYIKTLVTNLPSAEGASPAFKTAAELYKSMSANPAYREMYFDEKTSQLLGAYNSAASNGSDTKAAYVAAYQSVSPEAKAAGEAYVKTPEFQKLLSAEAKEWAAGASIGWFSLSVPEWLGGATRPRNVDALHRDVGWEMRSWRTSHPNASDEQAKQHAESWTRRNYVVDKVTQVAVRVPPGLSGPAAQEALSERSKVLTERYKLDNDKWKVEYRPTGTEGYYAAKAVAGAGEQLLEFVDLQGLISAQRQAKLLTSEEHQAVYQARQNMAAGLPLGLTPELMTKAVTTGGLDKDALGVYQTREKAKFMDRAGTIPNFDFGKPSFDNLQFTRKGPVVDNRMTAKSALDFARNPSFDQTTKHSALAASVITMGEGLALNRYPDPAKGAGFNIGMGYNLNANKGNAEGDLARAGVPKERVADVIEGRASLTQKQAESLLLVALPRYTKEAEQVAEAASPGLWKERMTPAQKAVMVDVAWQVGDSGQFKKAWASLAAGDAKAFADQIKVTYVNQSGARVEDTRRNNLRASMLAGFSQWEATVQKFGQLPSSKLQAALIPTNK